jgi:lipoate---protein ligase
MHFLDLTLPTPAENLACDEALLDFFEEKGGDGALRFWEPDNYFVVVGYANRVEQEVNVGACEAAGIPIFRRCSGGGTVVQGPGCLNYSLIAPIEENGPLQGITAANRSIMERNRQAIEKLLSHRSGHPGTIEVCGHTDLALVTRHSSLFTRRKFSGNAQRRKKNFLLFHGTFLLKFDIPMIEKFLRMPSQEPDYRRGRSHETFLTNLDFPVDAVKTALRAVWNAGEPMKVVPRDAVASLARDKYVTKEWNFKF